MGLIEKIDRLNQRIQPVDRNKKTKSPRRETGGGFVLAGIGLASGFTDKTRLEHHGASIGFAVDFVIAIDDADAFDFCALLEGGG